jgi:23S rRNA G2445 N2-methylase RlmL
MTDLPYTDDGLKRALGQAGFRPARSHVDALFAALAEGERDRAELVERALARLGVEAAELAMARFEASRAPERGRLVRLVARVAQEKNDARLARFVFARLDDADAKTRRNAVIASAKLPLSPAAVEESLVAAWEGAPLELRRSIAASLGKLAAPAGDRGLALLEAVTADDGELARIVGEARLKLRRTLGRAGAGGRIDGARALEPPPRVHLHCRAGLEEILAGELKALRGPPLAPRVVAPGRVEARLAGPLARLLGARTWYAVAFPLDAGAERDPARALVHALTSPEALRILRAYTDGPLRYRIEWASGGHRRGQTFQAAKEAAARAPELLNDPTASLWEVVVREDDRITVELSPRGLADDRFAWRQEHVPASSHPTIAAALARLGGARDDDVVWDPFAGAGSELVERARLGPFTRLIGTDLDGAALARARANLDAAGVKGAELLPRDACDFAPDAPVTLLLTNPPMGRRVLDKHRTTALFERFVPHACEALAPDGRFVWVTPRGELCARLCERHGLRTTLRRRLDMGGFDAELQCFVKEPSAAGKARGPAEERRRSARAASGARSGPGRR